jgi:hypothetical protein
MELAFGQMRGIRPGKCRCLAVASLRIGSVWGHVSWAQISGDASSMGDSV